MSLSIAGGRESAGRRPVLAAAGCLRIAVRGRLDPASGTWRHPETNGGFKWHYARLQKESRTHPTARQFDVVIERDSEGYDVASVPQIPACHTQAQSLDEVMLRVREAIELCLEVEGVPGQDLEFVGIQRVTITA